MRNRFAGPRPRALLVGLAAVSLLAVGVTAETIPASTAGYFAKISNSTNTTATAPYFKCADAEASDKSTALFQYFLRESSGSTTALDSGANSANGTYQGAMTTNTAAPLACARDTGGAYVLNGSTSYLSTPTSYVNPTTFSEEVWFKTTVSGGRIIGFGSSQTGSSASYDRQIYVSATGQIIFGTYNNAYQVVTSPKAYTDGSWHHVAATMSPATGMRLYLDGQLVASNATYTTAQNFTGYFRVGYDTLNTWPSVASNYYFTGQMRFAAVYSTALTAQQIANHQAAGQ